MDATENVSTVGGESGNIRPTHRFRWTLLLLLGLCVIGRIAFYARHVYLHAYVYIDRHPDISCVDAITGNPLKVEVNIVKHGRLDDDPDATFSIGIVEGGKISADRNIWGLFEATAPGYQPTPIKLDEHSPETMTLKMVRMEVTK